MKKFANLFLACILAVAMFSFAGATNIGKGNDNSTDADYFILKDGVFHQVPLDEVKSRLLTTPNSVDLSPSTDLSNITKSNNDIVPCWSDIWEFTDSKYQDTYWVEDLAQPLSSWMQIDGSGTGSFTVSSTKTFDRAFSIEVGREAKDAVAGKIGASWAVSISKGVSQTLPCNKISIARLVFVPECDVYTGKLVHRKWNYTFVDSKDLTVYQPTTIEGGLYKVVYK